MTEIIKIFAANNMLNDKVNGATSCKENKIIKIFPVALMLQGVFIVMLNIGMKINIKN